MEEDVCWRLLFIREVVLKDPVTNAVRTLSFIDNRAQHPIIRLNLYCTYMCAYSCDSKNIFQEINHYNINCMHLCSVYSTSKKFLSMFRTMRSRLMCIFKNTSVYKTSATVLLFLTSLKKYFPRNVVAGWQPVL
jgi:hypothetical protein